MCERTCKHRAACLALACLAACQHGEPDAATSRAEPRATDARTEHVADADQRALRVARTHPPATHPPATLVGASGVHRVWNETADPWDEPVHDWLALADAVFTERFGPPPAEPPRDVVLAGEDFWPRTTCEHPYERLVERGAAAFFSRSCGKVHVRRDVTSSRGEDLRATVIHEAVHQRVARQGFPVLAGPGAWITEGLGLYFECLDEDGRIKLARSQRLSQARTMLRSGQLPSLVEFVSMDALELEALGQERVLYSWHGRIYERQVSLHHTQAFAVMAFLHRRFQSELPALVAAGLESGLTLELFERHLGLEAAELQRAFDDSFRALVIAGIDF